MCVCVCVCVCVCACVCVAGVGEVMLEMLLVTMNLAPSFC